jgi:hypothetical protein
VVTFFAEAVSFSDDGDVVLVGFADKTESPDRYLILQRERVVEPQLKQAGFGAIYIEFGDQSRGGYGGLEEVIVCDQEVILKGNGPALAGGITVQFSVESHQLKALAHTLAVLVKGESRFIDNRTPVN